MATGYELVYTLDGSVTSGGNSNYAQDGGGLTQDGIEWSVTGNTTINPWRIGGKNLDDVDRMAYSKTAISDDIAKIEIEHGTKTLSAVNSMKVEVATDAAFANIVSTFTPAYEPSATVTVLRPDGASWANCYYRITYNVDAGGSNSYLQLISVKFYKESNGDTPAEPVVANFCLTEVGHLMEATPAQDSYVLLSIGSKGGKTIVRIDQDGEKNTAMFDYLQVTGLTQTGEDVAEGGVAAMAVEFDTPALTNDSMTLEILWSTVNWPGRWMVQNLRVAVADCQYAVVPLVPITCAEVYNMAKNDEVLLNDLTVTYANGKNVYVKDETGSMLLYLPEAATWAAGDVLSGVEGTVDIYKNLYEVKPSAEQVAAVVATAGEAPAPVEMTAAPVAADMNKYVVLKNVSVSAASFPDNKNMDATIGEQTFILRNNFNANIAFDTEKTYDITGVVAVYNDNVQVYFISAEEVVDPRMAGTYNIGGENADYATLSAAAADLRAKGLKGDVTLLICADIAEVANVGLVNETDYTITIAPNAAAKRTISFGDVADNVGPSGHIMIGYDMAAWASTATKNIVIDGSYEGEGQYLEFQAGTVGGVVVVFYGKASNSVVKNCRLINHRTTKTNYVVQFRTEQGAGSSKTNFGPSNVGFENCYMEVNKVTNTQAIYYNGSTAATDAGLPKDCYVRGCEIVSNLRGIFFNGAMNAVIEGNTFRLPSASGGFLAHGIMGNVQKGTIVVRGNKFIELGTMNTSPNEYGICGITASGGADVWVIENNYFAGLDSKADVSGKIVTLRYVRCGDSCVVRHNSFYLPAQTYKPATALVAAQAVTCLWLAGEKKYVAENNIFVSAETVANNSLIRGALNENVKNNVFFHNGGNAAILAGAVVAADSTAFFALEGTAGSKWKLPIFADAANGDLSITTADADLLMPRLEDILVDITGADRRENTYAGAFEGPEPSPTTAIDAVEVQGIQKIFRNGEVLIIRDGKTYNMMGQIVE